MLLLIHALTSVAIYLNHHWSGGVDKYCKTSNISRTLVGDKIIDPSDVVGASPVGAAPTTSSLSTWLQWIGKDNCKTRREPFKFWDLMRLVLDMVPTGSDESKWGLFKDLSRTKSHIIRTFMVNFTMQIYQIHHMYVATFCFLAFGTWHLT